MMIQYTYVLVFQYLDFVFFVCADSFQNYPNVKQDV